MREAVDEAIDGRGRLLQVMGEPGIGKTRTTEELTTYAKVNGARVHWGRCREDEGAPAYWPWVQAIRSFVREADPVGLAWQMGGGAAEIAQLVPEVAERLDIEPASAGDSEEARFRLFDSVTSFLVAAARDRPIVIVLDDLHWADEPSLLLLKFAAREIGSSGLLVVGTYRDVELGRHHPLARVLGEISGTEGTVRINLRGLSVDAVERYIGMTAGTAPPPGLAEAVQSQTDGNPFFVGEVVRLLASEGHLNDPDAWQGVIPQGVREVVGRRLDRLSEPTNQALRVAAAIGREFEEQLLVEVADLSPEELMTAAGEAISERLVTDLGDGRYSFSHALVRDTLYDEASPAQRAALHERIGMALEEICGEAPEARLGELAHHFLSAAPRGDIARAIDYAERAGAQAMDQLAYEEAEELYERALEVLELSDEPDETRRCALLLALGGARMSAGDFADSRQAYERAASQRPGARRHRPPGRSGDGDRAALRGGGRRRGSGRASRPGARGRRPRAQRRAGEPPERQGAGALLGRRSGDFRSAGGGGGRDRPRGRRPAGARHRPAPAVLHPDRARLAAGAPRARRRDAGAGRVMRGPRDGGPKPRLQAA